MARIERRCRELRVHRLLLHRLSTSGAGDEQDQSDDNDCNPWGHVRLQSGIRAYVRKALNSDALLLRGPVGADTKNREDYR